MINWLKLTPFEELDLEIKLLDFWIFVCLVWDGSKFYEKVEKNFHTKSHSTGLTFLGVYMRAKI